MPHHINMNNNKPDRFDFLLFLLWIIFLATFIFVTYKSINNRANADTPEPQFINTCQYAGDDPVDGCDNGDPCDPANRVKGGDGRCLDKTTQVEEPVVGK
ncbi:hypothetical protein [Caudoviricetes sp.]|nr:hypothetical protein [Caudoviricetes sp.]